MSSDQKWWIDACELASELSTARNLWTIRPLIVGVVLGAGTNAPTWMTCGLGVSEETGICQKKVINSSVRLIPGMRSRIPTN